MAGNHKDRTLILGIGNVLLSDEGIGVHVINELTRTYLDKENLTVMDGGTLSFTLADAIADSDRFIVVDAAELGASPGSVSVFENDEMDSFLTSGNKKSVHEVSLADVLAVTALTDRLPPKRAIVGIQPALVDWGEYPTKQVEEAIPLACEHIEKILESWN